MAGGFEPLRAALREGAAHLGEPLDDKAADRLLEFGELLLRWSRLHNLTAIRDPQAILTHHLLDCLAAVGPVRRHCAERSLPKPHILDVGSGAGLPGAVLALRMPHATVTCVDAVAKKTAFVRQLALELEVSNLEARHGRVEALEPMHADLVVSRAFASLRDFTALTRRHLTDRGCWLAMKGRQPEDEVSALTPEVGVFHVEPIRVPGLVAERCLLWLAPR